MGHLSQMGQMGFELFSFFIYNNFFKWTIYNKAQDPLRIIRFKIKN